MYYSKHTRLFSEGSISEIFDKHYLSIQSTIETESDNYILNVNESSYIESLEETYKFETPEVLFEEVMVEDYTGSIPAEHFPIGYRVEAGEKYDTQVVRYCVPCKGNPKLLRYSPLSSYQSWQGEFYVEGNYIITEFVNFHNIPELIVGGFRKQTEEFYKNYHTLILDINRFNAGLKVLITNMFKERKDAILRRKNILSSLGVPLRKNNNVSPTFNVPVPQLREKIFVKPVVKETGFVPEPTLDQENYLRILKVINDVGKNFERMPSTSRDKSEETLRDHILMNLDPHFQNGSATGETFNNTGKTDILLRYDSSVVFIAECKYWTGEKGHHETLDQLLGYLTWRDTKTSVVVFVKQKSLSEILVKIKKATAEHPNYLGFVSETAENWFNYRFHINGDKNREVKVAVQVFHLPV